MPATNPLYQDVFQMIKQIGTQNGVRQTSLARLSLLVLGLIEARSGAMRRIAEALDVLELTGATRLESIVRRLRRTLGDTRLEAETCYLPVLGDVLDWPALIAQGEPVLLIVDETSHTDEVHLLRLSVSYRGSAIPLAWAVWEQNTPRGDGQYWQQVDRVLERAARALQRWLPAHIPVVVLADRAYDVPNFIDRVAARGWHWVVRAKANSQLRFCDAAGQEQRLATLVQEQVPQPGTHWATRGRVFKDAGWRAARVVVVWETGTQERLAVLASPATDPVTDQTLVDWYERRFWIEASFRHDKDYGWGWEDSQVRDPQRQERLLLGMAWASVAMLCLGAAEADSMLTEAAARPIATAPPRRVEHARDSLFRLGMRQARRWLYGNRSGAFPWRLPQLSAPSWTRQYEQVQLGRYLQTVPP